MGATVQVWGLLIVVVASSAVGWMLVRQLRALNRRVRADTVRVEDVRGKLQSIRDMLTVDDVSSHRLAIIETGKLFDFVLKQMGIEGKDAHERLQVLLEADRQFHSMQDVVQLAQRLGDQPTAQATLTQATGAVDRCEEALEALQVL